MKPRTLEIPSLNPALTRTAGPYNRANRVEAEEMDRLVATLEKDGIPHEIEEFRSPHQGPRHYIRRQRVTLSKSALALRDGKKTFNALEQKWGSPIRAKRASRHE